MKTDKNKNRLSAIMILITPLFSTNRFNALLKLILSVCLLTISFASYAQTITVKQDGTGQFTTIQAAVNVAWNGDTILVYPGIYYENVRIEHKNIVLGSLTLTTGDNSYIRQTVIDANFVSRPLFIWDAPGDVTINGFEIRNGYQVDSVANMGGGILAIDCNDTVRISNCFVHNNLSESKGGGICVYRNNSALSNVTIAQNKAKGYGGGISIARNNCLFDSVNLCNIYENYAAAGTDISKGTADTLEVYVDTFTVINPDKYYAFSVFSASGFPVDDINFHINTGKIEPTYEDLYVSETGSNSNSGLTPAEPLQTISYALLKMQSDSLSPDTIHVAAGYYCDTTNGENFPLSLKSFTTVKGASRKSTILDPRYLSNHLKVNKIDKFINFEKFTLINGNGNKDGQNDNGSIHVRKSHDLVFDSLLIKNCIGNASSGGVFSWTHRSILKNTDFIDNNGGEAFRVAKGPEFTFDTVWLYNLRFINNLPNYSNPYHGSGGAYRTPNFHNNIHSKYLTVSLYNCLFHHNRTKENLSSGGVISLSAFGSTVNVINCTLTENRGCPVYPGNIGPLYGGNMHVYNSILYDNFPAEIYMFNLHDETDTNFLYIQNSLVDGGGVTKVKINGPNNIFVYDEETNIDTDPLFYGGPDFPYNLSDESPCIDAGTLDLPQFILDHMPDVDLAGNPRIVNDKIDMGCYEWNPTVGINEQPATANRQPETVLNVFPNPFSTQTTVSAKWEESAKVNIEVYNNAGLLIKTLQSGKQLPGSCQIPWDATLLPSGIYYVILRINGNITESVKVVKE